MNRIHTKTYGVRAGIWKGKATYFVLLDGVKTSLHYQSHDFALQKALEFCHNCYQPFTDLQGNRVHFKIVRNDWRPDVLRGNLDDFYTTGER